MASTALTRRDIVVLAWPIVLANASIPLLGLADTFEFLARPDAVALPQRRRQQPTVL